MHRAKIGSLFALLALFVWQSLAAQAPGDRVQVSYNLAFSSYNQSMWGPANAPSNLDFTVPLFDESWSEGGTANGIFSAFGLQWGPSISANTSGRVGLSFRISDIGTGAVNLDYPVRVVLDLPAPNSFRDGEAVTIDSRFDLLPGWSLGTTPPGGALTLNGIFGTHLGASGQFCFFGCPGNGTLVNFNIPNDPFELFSVTSQGTLTLPAVLPAPFPRPLVIETLPYQFGGLLDPFGPVLGWEGPVDGPHVTTTATLGSDGLTLTAAGQHRFVDLNVDLDHYLTFVGVPPLGFQSNPALELVTGASFGYDVANLALLFGVTQRQTFRFVPRVTLTAQFPVAVEFEVLNADGSAAATGTGTTAHFDVGQSLRVTMPAGPRDPLPGTPTYGLANTFTSATDFAFNERLVVSAGRFSLHTPNANVTETFTETVCSIFGIDAIEALCRAAGGVLETVTRTVTHVVPPANVDLGPLFSQQLVNETQTLPLFPTGTRSGQWQLAGLQSFTEAPFVLDPEDPRIAVATALSSGVMSGGPAGSILQTLRVRNEGDVPLSAAALRDAVAALLGGAFTVMSVSSPTLVTNPSFNGGAQPDLLGAGNALAPGAEGQVQVVFAVNAGNIYHASVHAAGRSPIGTNVSADASDALGVVVFEIIPDQVSAWSNGVLPTRVTSVGIDAGLIDPAGLRLEGIAPESWNLTTSGALILKFLLPDVLSALEQRILAGIPLPAAPGGGALRQPVTLGTLVSAVMNGSGELGELRAFVMSGGSIGGPKQFAATNGIARVLVLTGSLRDGTRLIGDDDLTVMQGGQ
ncbi:MAG: hypothetical protein ACREMI_07375 [Gemmatimonadales bacterium]